LDWHVDQHVEHVLLGNDAFDVVLDYDILAMPGVVTAPVLPC
jgi:hypothetical protein